LFDPLLVQKYFQAAGGDPYKMIDLEPTDTLTQSEKDRLEDALADLTSLEKEVYLMARGNCMSFADIANLLCVSKSTIQDTIERAERKIKHRINYSLFCLT
jgi:RNA polymerase sigma-70 factor (ECF subfamily)